MLDKLFCFFFSLVLFVPFSLDAQDDDVIDTGVIADIKVLEKDNRLSLVAVATNRSNATLSVTYQFEITKGNTFLDNSSKSAQGGQASIDPTKQAILSRSVVNLLASDTVAASLKVFFKDSLVSEIMYANKFDIDHSYLSQKQETDSAMFVSYTGLKLKTFVSDHTKTKVGRDFYEILSASIRDKLPNLTEYVSVEETPGFTVLSTTLEVKVGYDSILQARAQPNEEYLKLLSDEAIKRIILYLKRTNKLTQLLNTQ